MYMKFHASLSQPILTARQWNIHKPYCVTAIPKFDQFKLPETPTNYQTQQHSLFSPVPYKAFEVPFDPILLWGSYYLSLFFQISNYFIPPVVDSDTKPSLASSLSY